MLSAMADNIPSLLMGKPTFWRDVRWIRARPRAMISVANTQAEISGKGFALARSSNFPESLALGTSDTKQAKYHRGSGIGLPDRGPASVV